MLVELPEEKWNVIEVEHDNQLYRVEIRRYYVCTHCGEHIKSEDTYANKSQSKLGYFLHLECAKHLASKSPLERFDDDDRYHRVLSRISRDKVISPDEVEKLLRKFKSLYGRRKSFESHMEYKTGAYKGKPLAYVFGTPEYFSWSDFWRQIKEQKIESPRKELAILLKLSGDENAIAHSSPRNSTIIRRGKAANTRNNTKHTGRGVRRISGDGNGSELQSVER